MKTEKVQSIIESILFSAGRSVSMKELQVLLEVSKDEIEQALFKMKEEYNSEYRGIELIEINDSYQLCTKKENYEYVYEIIDKRVKPKLSNAALETLAIVAYNPKITRAEIEAIRGVAADATIYKLLEYGLIEEAGKIDLPGRPMSYRTTGEFLRLFGYSSLNDLPELPKYKMDENHQIVIDEIVEENEVDNKEEINEDEEMKEFEGESEN